jgi:hypothetical protein
VCVRERERVHSFISIYTQQKSMHEITHDDMV